MDAFFVSVEEHDNPALKGHPVVVGYDGPRGVVSTANYEARKFGVHSAMPVATAHRLCPQLIVVEGHYHRYKEVSAQIHAIFHDYTDLVEPLSLDEAYLDVTTNKKSVPLAMDIAQEIKNRIQQETGLTASAGVLVLVTANSLPKWPATFASPTAFAWCIPRGPSLSLTR